MSIRLYQSIIKNKTCRSHSPHVIRTSDSKKIIAKSVQVETNFVHTDPPPPTLSYLFLILLERKELSALFNGYYEGD